MLERGDDQDPLEKPEWFFQCLTDPENVYTSDMEREAFEEKLAEENDAKREKAENEIANRKAHFEEFQALWAKSLKKSKDQPATVVYVLCSKAETSGDKYSSREIEE